VEEKADLPLGCGGKKGFEAFARLGTRNNQKAEKKIVL